MPRCVVVLFWWSAQHNFSVLVTGCFNSVRNSTYFYATMHKYYSCNTVFNLGIAPLNTARRVQIGYWEYAYIYLMLQYWQYVPVSWKLINELLMFLPASARPFPDAATEFTSNFKTTPSAWLRQYQQSSNANVRDRNSVVSLVMKILNTSVTNLRKENMFLSFKQILG
jgi:hypothetical protein